jgi:hypothetical protein
MVEDAAANGAHLCYHVGDVVYFDGEVGQFYAQFYEPMTSYKPPIVGIPGNHDGDPVAGDTSLNGFMRYFCASTPQILPESKDAPKVTRMQPNCYWTLTAELATIIGMYTNVPSGGEVDDVQVTWLVEELNSAPTDRALLVALHHPPVSADSHHGGSAKMLALLDAACTKAKRFPDLVMAGHVHNWQRFTRKPGGKTQPNWDIPYLVVGAGGYWHLHNCPTGLALPWNDPNTDFTLENFVDDHHGFLRLTISKTAIEGQYYTVPRPQEAWSNPAVLADSFILDLAKHTVSTGGLQ